MMMFFVVVYSERELVMDLERLKLTKSVKPKKSRDKVQLTTNFFLPRPVLLAVS